MRATVRNNPTNFRSPLQSAGDQGRRRRVSRSANARKDPRDNPSSRSSGRDTIIVPPLSIARFVLQNAAVTAGHGGIVVARKLVVNRIILNL